MRTTIITTAQPLAFAGVVAASGIALSPFMIEARATARVDGGGSQAVRVARASDGRMMRFAGIPAR